MRSPERNVSLIGFLTMFMVGVSDLIVIGIISPMSQSFGVEESLIGQLVTIYAVSFGVLGPVLTKITRKYDDKQMLCISMVVFILCAWLTTMVSTYLALCVVRVVLASAASLITVKLLAIGTKVASASNQAKIVANIYVGFCASNILGVPIGTLLSDAVGWKSTFYAIFALSAVCLVLIALFFQPTGSTKERTTNGEYQVVERWKLTSVLLVLLFMMASNSILFTYIEPMMKTHGFSIESVSLALFIAGVCGIIGSKLGNVLSESLGYYKSFMTICSVYLIAIVVMSLYLDSLYVFLICIGVWNLFHWGTNPTVQFALLRLIKGDPSQVFSYNISILNLGIGMGAFLGGLAYSFDPSFMSSFILAIILGVLSFMMIVFLLSDRKRAESEWVSSSDSA